MWLFPLLIFALIFWRVIWQLQVHWRWKILLAVLTLTAAFKLQLTHLFGGPMFFAPELPKWILISSAWCYTVVFLLFFLLIISEFIQLGMWLVRRKISAGVHSRINLGLLIGALLLATWGIVQGTAMPHVREVTLEFPNLPKEANGMTIALLADLHADGVTRHDRIRAIVKLTNELKPDLIVIAGDFVDGTLAQRGGDLEPLRKLSAKYGVWGVPGNHEYYSGYTDWIKFLPTLGIRMLLNEHETLPNRVVLSGVTDPAASRMGEVHPDIRKATEGVLPEQFNVLLSHQPVLAREASGNGIDLQLSGHTHGGMIFGIDRIVAAFNGGFVSGLYNIGDLKLYVSNGSGIWNGFPVRIGQNAETVLLRLVSSD